MKKNCHSYLWAHRLKTGYRRALAFCIVLLCATTVLAQSLTLTGTNHMELGDYVTLYPSTSGGSWSSSNTSIATVDRGVVQSVAPGTATISYTSTVGTVTSLATMVVTVDPVTTVCRPWQRLGIFGGSRSAAALDNTGTPWIAYPAAGSNQLTVKKYSGTGTTWTTVGTAAFTTAGTDYMDIAVDRAGTPYVAFADLANSRKVTVMKYNGTSWVVVGSAGMSPREVAYCKLAIDSAGTVYLAYIEYTPGGLYPLAVTHDEVLRVKKYNGSAWSDLDSVAYSPSSLWGNGNDHNEISLKLDVNGVPHLLFYANESSSLIIKYNGTAWVALPYFGFYGYSSLAISRNNNIYVSYEGSTDNCVVKKLQSGAWITLGDIPTNGGFGYSSVAVDANETPYISYQDGAAEWNSVVRKYTGGSWQSLGLGDGGYSTGLMVDGNGTVYSHDNAGQVVRLTKMTAAVPANSGANPICNGASQPYENDLGVGLWESSNPAIAGTAYSIYIIEGFSAGSATITYINGSCRQTTEVTVNPSPTIDASAGTTICVGSVTTLTGSPSGGTWFNWNPARGNINTAGEITGLEAGFVSIEYHYGGCHANQTVLVEAPAGPLTGPATVEQKRSIYVMSEANGGLWSASNANATVGTSGGTTRIGIVTGVTTGTVTLTYSASNSCGSSAPTKTVTVQPFSCNAWNYLGDATISASYGAVISPAVDPSGVPYVAYSDGNTFGLARVKKYTAGAWTQVGTGSISIGKALDTKIAIDGSGTPYVVFQDVGDSNKVKVNKYNGASWELVGATLPVTSKNPAIAIDGSGTPYVVCKDYANGNKASVVKFDGTNWVTVGTPGFSAGIVGKPVIAIDGSGTPYVAYTDSSVDGKATVMKYNGSAWVTVGTAGLASGMSNGNSGVSLAIDGSGTPYVAYADVTVGTVLKYNGSSWVAVGYPHIVQGVISANVAIGPGNTPYICYSTGSSLGVMQFDGTGWKHEGMHAFTGGSADVGVLTIDASGNKYVAYRNWSSSGLVSVMKFGSGLPAISGSGGVCPGSTIALSDLNSGGTWSSSNTSIATIGSTGVVTGIGTGITTMSYSMGGSCVVTKNVTSGAYAGTSIGGSSTVRQGAVAVLVPDVLGGVWSVSNANATVSTTGVVTGVAMGAVTVTYTTFSSCGTATVTKDMTVTLPSIFGPMIISGGGTTTLSNSIPGGTWSTGCSEIATVSSDGTVTGVSKGMATITYTAAGDFVTAVVTVNTTTSAITGTYSLCAGSSSTLNHPVSGGTWSSSNDSIVTVNSDGVISGVTAGVATISYDYGPGCTSTVSVTINALPAPITGTAVVCVGTTTTLHSATTGGTWSSVTPAVATVSTAGVVTGVSVSGTTISYTLGTGCAVTRIVTVNAGASAGTITGASSVAIGSTITLGNTVTGGTWSASNGNATVTSTGAVTGVASGSVTISYSVSSACGTVAATKVLAVGTSTVTPITGTLSLCAGTTTALDNATPGGTWASGNTTVATISSTGVVTGVTPGMTTITYSTSGGDVTAVVTVNNTPSVITGTLGICIGGTTSLNNSASGSGTWTSSDATIAAIGSATGYVSGLSAGTAVITYALGTGCTATTIVTVNDLPGAVTGTATVCVGSTTVLSNSTTGGTWSSSAATVATVGSTGVVTGIGSGVTNVTYALGTGCRATITVTVNALPAPITGATSVCEGGTTNLGSSTLGGIWSSSDMTIATVGTSGVVSGLVPGAADIAYATAAGCARIATVTVNSNPIISGSATVCPGGTTLLTSSIAGGAWTGGTAAIATIGTTGLVTGVGAGTANVTYSLSTGCKAMITVTVGPAPATITGTMKACPGTSTALSNTTAGGSWSTSDVTIATADATTGVITGVAAGTVTVTYTTGAGCYRTTTVTINPAPAAIAGAAVICAGSSVTLTDVTPGLSWASGNTAVATIGAGTGVVTGVSTGFATITYTAASTNCIATAIMTVNGIPAAIAGPATGCTGSNITLTNSVPGGAWSSSNTATATVDATTGVVTGVASGIVTITYTTGAGCYKTKAITINNSPTVSGYSTVCIGLTTTLSGGGSGTWSSGNPSVATIVTSGGYVTGVAAGTAVMTFTSGTTTCATGYTVTVMPVPAAITGTTTACTGTIVTLSNTTPGGSWSSSNTAGATVGSTTGIVNAVGTGGTVTISYSFGTNCRVTTPFTLKPLPAVIAGSPSVCMPVTTTLTTTTSGGTWTSSNTSAATIGTAISASYGLVTGVSSGTSSITYTITATGCARSTVISVDAGLNPGTITSSGGFTLHTISAPTSVTLSSTGAAGGTWSSSNTAVATVNPATGVVTAIAAGSTTITYAVTANCTNIVTRAVNVVASRPGGSGQSGVGSVQLYPNPTSGAFTLVSDEAGTLHLFSIDGKEITNYSISAGINSLSLPRELAAGVYMCRYTSESGNTTMVRLVYER